MMGCVYCGLIGGHDFRCPLYDQEKDESDKTCRICGYKIRYGEEYIENQDGNTIHSDCWEITKQLVDFLDGEMKIMEENE